jgi:hypothetical protein
MLLVLLLAVQTVMWRVDHQLYVDEACASTFMAYGGETPDRFDKIVELRQRSGARASPGHRGCSGGR